MQEDKFVFEFVVEDWHEKDMHPLLLSWLKYLKR
jgi:hypothetical protein